LAFCEQDGMPSFARVCTALMVICALFWVTYLVIHNKALPDLGGAALFITVLYGTNKFSTMLEKKDPPAPPAPPV
jgi:hypothetical protein